jgi:FKBP-type peptidyl-prolyl cis-trans isomerase FkpA
MKTTHAAVVALALALGACDREPPAQEPVPEAGPEGAAATPAPMPALAPELDVRPAEMTPTASGVLVTEVRPGRGREATPGSLVAVEYRAWLPDGTLFEQRPSPEGFGPSEFVLGEGGPVPGLGDGVEGMRPGGVRRLLVPPDRGYGLVGRPAGVPPDATLVFEVRLLRVSEAPAPPPD